MEITTTAIESNKLLKPKKSRKKLYIFLFIVLLVSAFFFLFLRPYSEGYRDGYVTKLSKKGYVFKTWEGELIRNQFSAATSGDLFKFTVANEKIAEQLNKLEQRQYVKLHYRQYLFRIFFKGDTKYFIDEVHILANEQNINLNIPPSAGQPVTQPKQ